MTGDELVDRAPELAERANQPQLIQQIDQFRAMLEQQR